MSNDNEFYDDLSTSLKQALAIAKEQNKPSLKELLLSDMARSDEFVVRCRQENKRAPRFKY
ncbi:hypothetical protein NYA8BAC_00283 [Psychrobacter okhotskensis]|uniref:hypothetical protein n=1 Tax=Psychrobacter TaxID=497 RepID=UPI0019183688|nr:hypothetical protein [Psychrobacter immobilis]